MVRIPFQLCPQLQSSSVSIVRASVIRRLIATRHPNNTYPTSTLRVWHAGESTQLSASPDMIAVGGIQSEILLAADILYFSPRDDRSKEERGKSRKHWCWISSLRRLVLWFLYRARLWGYWQIWWLRYTISSWIPHSQCPNDVTLTGLQRIKYFQIIPTKVSSHIAFQPHCAWIDFLKLQGAPSLSTRHLHREGKPYSPPTIK
jgi:hypothetical protein